MNADLSHRAHYQSNGWVIVRRLFDPSVIAHAATEAEGLIRRTELIDVQNLRCRWTTHATTGECVFETFDPVADLSPACAAIARSPQLLKLVASLYGEEACLL